MPWNPKEIEHLKKRFEEKTAPAVIANELNKKFESGRNELAVKKMMTRLGLDYRAAAGPVQDGRRISKGEYLARKSKAIRAKVGQKATATDYVVLKSVPKDKKAYYPGIGPVISLGEVSVEAGGTTIKTIALRELQSKTAQTKTMHVLPKNFESKKIRALSTKEELKEALTYLEKGMPTNKLPKRTDERIFLLNELLNSGNLRDLAEIVVRAYRMPPSAGSAPAGTDAEKAIIAIHLLAAEYAEVMKVPYKQAEALINSKSGKKTLAQLSKTPESELSPG